MSNNYDEPPIIPAKTAIKSFRDSGYKSTAAAIAEIIDNAIEAKAKNIDILVFEKDAAKRGRTQKRISEIAIVDDGIGMDKEILKTSLQFGNGTKIKSREGIGRFGIGLPNASISQCRHVEVYSWQNSKCLQTYLDIDEIEEKSQQNINEINVKEIPKQIGKEIKKTNTGTVVIWSECDRLDVARGDTLYKRMQRDLCRIYRHFLDDDNEYGKKVNIKYKVVGTKFQQSLAANDPLYLMTPSNTPGFENKPIMELKTNDDDPREGKIELAFNNHHTGIQEISNVLFRFSFIKPEFLRKEGDPTLSNLMDHLKRNMGISFVRSGREVDFGNFNYFTKYDTTERWWGCEIRFEPILDEIFGVSFDKQNVKDMGKIDPEIKKDKGITDEDVESDPKLKLKSEITKRLTHFHKTYMKIRKEITAGTRSGGSRPRSVSIADRIYKNRNILTRSKVVAGEKTKKQIDEEIKQRIEQIAKLTGKTYSPDQLKKLIEETKKLEVNIDNRSWEGSQFFTTEVVGKTATVVLNLNHKFHNKLYADLADKLDQTNVEIVDLMLMAWARVEDELSVTSIKLEDFVKIREKWGQELSELLDEQERVIN